MEPRKFFVGYGFGLLLLIILLGAWYLISNTPTTFAPSVNKKTEVVKTENKLSDPKNTTYLIDNEKFTLINGVTEKNISPDSVTKNKVSVFGEPSFGDLDSDGDNDAVIILVNEAGGSGTFYYAALAININGEFKGTDTILLGDRISPQSYLIRDKIADVNYVVRAFDEPFSTPPSIGKTLRLKFDPENLRLIEVEI